MRVSTFGVLAATASVSCGTVFWCTVLVGNAYKKGAIDTQNSASLIPAAPLPAEQIQAVTAPAEAPPRLMAYYCYDDAEAVAVINTGDVKAPVTSAVPVAIFLPKEYYQQFKDDTARADDTTMIPDQHYYQSPVTSFVFGKDYKLSAPPNTIGYSFPVNRSLLSAAGPSVKYAAEKCNL